MNRLYWEFNYEGEWNATSSVRGEGGPLRWTIAVCDDGTFSVGESDPELTDRKETFDWLKEAKEWCQEREEEAVAEWEQSKEVCITYTNHRGETAARHIVPKRLWFGETEWHPEPQWLLEAFDLDRKDDRTFALSNIHRWSGKT